MTTPQLRTTEARQEQLALAGTAQARLLDAQARMAEIKVRRMEGESLSRAGVEEVAGTIFAIFRQRMLALTSRVTPLLFGKTLPQIKETLDGSVREALNDLAVLADERFAQRIIDGGEGDVGGGAGSKATPSSDGKRVGGRKPRTKPRIKRRAGKVAHKQGTIPAGGDGRGKRPDGRDGGNDVVGADREDRDGK